jgi:hypothetical protein
MKRRFGVMGFGTVEGQAGFGATVALGLMVGAGVVVSTPPAATWAGMPNAGPELRLSPATPTVSAAALDMTATSAPEAIRFTRVPTIPTVDFSARVDAAMTVLRATV